MVVLGVGHAAPSAVDALDRVTADIAAAESVGVSGRRSGLGLRQAILWEVHGAAREAAAAQEQFGALTPFSTPRGDRSSCAGEKCNDKRVSCQWIFGQPFSAAG